jgi:phosphoserine phosphatase RsbU/P
MSIRAICWTETCKISDRQIGGAAVRTCGCGLDLDLASHVQQLLFPKGSPACGWACIGIRNRMVQALGGDFFDFITMPDGGQAVMIGDVTGHGLHASVVMSLVYGYIHHCAATVTTPDELVRQLNSFLLTFAERSRDLDHLFSSTIFFGVIDPQTLRMDYVNAGHPAPLAQRAGEVFSLTSTAPPVGFFRNPEIGTGTFQFARGDRLLLYTDGITEAINNEGVLFSLERLKGVLRRQDGDHQVFLQGLFAALDAFTGDAAFSDDCTAIVVDFQQQHPTLCQGCPHAR